MNNLTISTINNEFNVTGHVTIEVLDATTLEVKRTIEDTNSLTKQGAYFMATYNGLIGRSRVSSAYPTPWQNQTSGVLGFLTPNPDWYNRNTYMGISTTYIHPDTKSIFKLPGIIGQSSSILYNSYAAGPPITISFRSRWNAPGTNRTVRSVCLYNSVSTALMTIVGLSTPCEQGADELLDITYRLQFDVLPATAITGNMLPVSPSYGMGMVQSNTARDYSHQVSYYMIMPHKIHDKTKTTYNSWGRSPYADSSKAIMTTLWNRKGTMSLSRDINSDVGKLMQSVYTRCNDESGSISANEQFGIMDTFGNLSFTNKPIQPVFAHQSPSTVPFLDNNYSGVSAGTLTITGDNWTGGTHFPDYYRVEYTTSGDVGTAKYTYRNRILTGFRGNSYRSAFYYDVFATNVTGTWYGYSRGTMEGMHGSSKMTPTWWEEYTATKFVYFDRTGISIVDIGNGEGVTFDAITTPALPVTYVNQVGVNFANGDVWVACRDTGLYRIQDPYGTPTITKITTIDTFTNVSSAYAVSLGYNESIWCAINGALAKTTDDGATWTVYNPTSPVVFDATGITDNNWHRITTIRTDINSADDELIITYGDDDIFTYIKGCWWSQNNTGTIVTSTLGHNTTLFNRYWVARCSHYGSLWILSYPNNSSGPAIYLGCYKFGATGLFYSLNATDVPGGYTISAPYNHNIAFYYDYYNVPHVVAIRRNASTSWVGVKNSRNLHVGVIVPQELSSSSAYGGQTNATQRNPWLGSYGMNASYHKSPLVYINKRMQTDGNDYDNPSFSGTTTCYAPGGHHPIYPYQTMSFSTSEPSDPGFMPDSLNGRYTPFEEFVWNKMHWNPNTSQWENHYYQPATDTSLRNIDGIRHNFDTESHTFTGRSLLDITDVFVGSGISDTFTFVANVTSSPKMTGRLQEIGSTLFALEDDTQYIRLMWNDYSTSDIKVEYGSGASSNSFVFSTALLDDTKYHLVCSVAQTGISLYIDDIQLGTTHVPTIGLDFSTITPSFRAYIGAHVYYRQYHMRVPMPFYFYKGTLTNIQIWDTAWDQTTVSTDFVNPDGVIDINSVNLMCRYDLTEQLIESKVTHDTPDELQDNVMIQFNSNLVTPNESCLETEFYTFGVVDGILKDNVTSFSHQWSIYSYVDTDVNFNRFFNSVGGTTIQPAAAPITTLVHWIQHTPYMHMHTGEVTTANGSNVGVNAALAVESLPADTDGEISFNFAVGTMTAGVRVSFSTDTTTGYSSASSTYSLYVIDSSTLAVRQGGTTNLATTTMSFGDTFTIRRTGLTIDYLQNGSIFYTHVAATAPALAIKYSVDTREVNSSGIVNATVTYNNINPVMFAGDYPTLSDCFTEPFLGLEYSPLSTMQLYIDGALAPIVVHNGAYHMAPTPATGGITVLPFGGIFLFHPDDIGKEVTGYCTYIADKW